MPRGGKREGAGRPKGARGKRVKSQLGKARLNPDGIMPLDFMLELLRDERAKFEDRKWAAQQAAPYLHAKLVSGKLEHDVSSELAELMKEIDGRSRADRGIPLIDVLPDKPSGNGKVH